MSCWPARRRDQVEGQARQCLWCGTCFDPGERKLLPGTVVLYCCREHQKKAGRRRNGAQHEVIRAGWKHVLYLSQQGVCALCGESLPEQTATFDHIRPASHGGPWDLANLQLAHFTCNQLKASHCPGCDWCRDCPGCPDCMPRQAGPFAGFSLGHNLRKEKRG